MALNLKISKDSPVPLYHQVVQGFEDAVNAGELPPGTKLENEIELARQLGLSRPTMRKAMDELVRAGLLVRKRGVGTQVVAPSVRRPLQLSSLHDDLAKSGSRPTTKVLEFGTAPAPAEVAGHLGLAAGADAYHMIRLRSVDGKPLAVMENWVPLAFGTLTEEELAERGLYDLLRGLGINFHLAHQRVGAALATRYQADLLEMEPREAVVTMERTATDDQGRPVETGHHVYAADLYSFEMTLMQH
ncbi:GntR family transcriptional regulator [Zhihengliuella salsuginis]|uniref:GntR family transcriptional regulator n=1 Tax=Zhihengliuella salsuginis TaxID=578222 RepID=A0ABQ3GL55_9MICC|nr:GntR family transcriptional regulator [Zhihengliuella salsuginis]GHD10376.1 GntR family transcriptional regulator [Zhihengliuella salsuginis]